MHIRFLGAAGTVTGSKYLLTLPAKNKTEPHQVLIDCGLFQGHKDLRLRNWATFPYKAREIDAVILTHAHIDHSGYLPLLVKQGFRGKIYCTQATFDLCKILLPDSGYLQEEEAHFANQKGYSKHARALPLYTMEEAKIALQYFAPCEFEKNVALFDQLLRFEFNPAGHILGASTIKLNHQGKTTVFSGDLGRPHDALLHAPKPITQADYLILESTYGDRLHDSENPIDQLGKIINQTIQRKGSIIIPSFAVGRAQNLLYYIHQLKAQHRIPENLPVYLDSPMAVSATELLRQHLDELKLDYKDCHYLNTVAQYVNSQKESILLDKRNLHQPKIIISASGMATGGRVLHHLKTYGPDAKNTILFTGFQAPGTRGNRLVSGERRVKMLGEFVTINAQIIMLNNTSAHADYQETVAWLKHFQTPPRKIFITHGEPKAAAALKQHIIESLHWPSHSIIIPQYLESGELA